MAEQKFFLTKEELEKAYQDSSTWELAKQLKVSQFCVRRWLKKYNIKPRPDSREVGKKLMKELAYSKLKEFYVENKYTTYEIADLYGVSHEAIRCLLRKHNIKVISRRHNPFIFSGCNENIAYLLGVIYGDGWFNRSRFALRVKDREFAQEFKNSCENLGFHVSFGEDNYWRGMWLAQLYSKDFTEWLRQVTILDLPRLLTTSDLEKRFIRGIYDSEGSLYIYPNGTRRNIRISNTNMPLLNYVASILIKQGYNPRIYKQSIVKGAKIFIKDHYAVATKECYDISLGIRDEVNRFCKEIGSSIPRKVAV